MEMNKMKRIILSILVIGLLLSTTTISIGKSEAIGGVVSGTAVIASYVSNGNDPPSTPVIDGLTEGNAGTEYNYEATSYDNEGDDIDYIWDWGDGNFSEWLGPYPSGETCFQSYTWSENGTYLIQVKARDIHGAESDWGTLEVTMPVNQMVSSSTQSTMVQSCQQVIVAKTTSTSQTGNI